MNTTGVTIQCKVHFKTAARGQKRMAEGTEAAPKSVARVQRISRLMALAIRFDELLRRGEVSDYAELARLGHVTRARVTQIMNLLKLAPDIQEAILFLPPVEAGHDLVKEWQVRPIAAEPEWHLQRRKWFQVNGERPSLL